MWYTSANSRGMPSHFQLQKGFIKMIHTRVGDDPISISDSYRFPRLHEPMRKSNIKNQTSKIITSKRVGSMSGLDAWHHAMWAVQSILQDVADWNAVSRAAVCPKTNWRGQLGTSSMVSLSGPRMKYHLPSTTIHYPSIIHPLTIRSMQWSKCLSTTCVRRPCCGSRKTIMPSLRSESTCHLWRQSTASDMRQQIKSQLWNL